MMRTTTTLRALGGAYALAACGGGATPASGPQVTPATPPTSAAPATQPAPIVGAPGAPEPASPFNVIGELPDDLTLFGAGERGFLISPVGVELQLVGDEILQDPRLSRGLPQAPAFMFTVDTVGGRYPDAFWLSTSEPRARSGFGTLWRWDGKNWQRKEAFGDTHFVVGIQPWVGGRLLALEQSAMQFDASFSVLSGDSRIAVPQFTKTRAKEEFGYCVTQMKPDAWQALPTGEVIVFGQHCDPQQDYPELAVERWAPGAKTSTIDIMPGLHAPGDLKDTSFTGTGVAAISANDVWVTGVKEMRDEKTPATSSPYLAHFDGKTWQTVASPIRGNVGSLWTEPGGGVFATSSQGELWQHGSNGKWSELTWPTALTKQGAVTLQSFWQRAPDDSWAVVNVGAPHEKASKRYLLHTHPAVNAVPTLEAMHRNQRSFSLPGPPVEWCETRFVLLYTLGRKAPADYDYPATRAALKGHSEFAVEGTRFVEFEREGRRYFGARVPDFDLGKKLAKLVKEKVPGSTPELVCLDPLENRTLDIDLKTGALRK